MSIQKINPRFAVLLLMMVAIAAMRIPNAAQLTPWANFTPIGGMALFGGACFNSRWKAIVFPLLTLLASDLVINLLVFKSKYGTMYGGWYIIYAIFVLIVLLGGWLIVKINFKNILLASVVAALSHWLIADFFVWMGGGTNIATGMPLGRNWIGLLQCYAQGLPFMKNFFMGTLVYSSIMFGVYEFCKAKLPVLKNAIA